MTKLSNIPAKETTAKTAKTRKAVSLQRSNKNNKDKNNDTQLAK